MATSRPLDPPFRNMDALTSLFRNFASSTPALLSALTRSSPKLYSLLKGLVGFVFLLNYGSLPFVWHIRIGWPVFVLHVRWQVHRLSYLLRSKEEKKAARRAWVEALSPVGANPFSREYIYRTWADIADVDYNMHLSNSSYPKSLDAVRMRSALDYFPGFMIAGGWIALAATHFHFIKEIPVLAPYQIRMSIATWDHKWMFLIIRFVTFPKKGKSIRREEHGHPTNGAPIPSLHTPANGIDTPASGTSTPFPGQPDLKALTATVSPVEADGAVVNCISVNQLVFKHGRITVPPALIMAWDGFCFHPGEGLRESKYSHVNPPPHWKHVQAIRAKGRKAEQAFLRGGWRDVPEGERWWETALAGSEELRAANLEKMRGVREGLEGGRAVAAELFG